MINKKEIKIKILFVLPNLSFGGAEKVVSFIADNIDKNIFDVQLIIIGFKKQDQHVLQNIDPIYLNKKRVLFSIFSLFKILMKNKPNIVFGTMIHINCMNGILSLFFKKIKFIGREASLLSYSLGLEKFANIKKIIIIYLYKKLDIIVCQSQDMYLDLIENFSLPKNKLVIIPNPITIENKTPKKITNAIPNFITIGRLSTEKGYERLLNIVAQLNYSFTYTIIGSGKLKDSILELINILGLQEKIILINASNNVVPYLMEADFYLQGSYLEGFPNGALESCALGTPVIAFNCPGGTKELIKNGINGLIINNLAGYIDTLQNIDILKNTFNNDLVKEYTFEKFNKDKILNMYRDLFLKIVKP